MKLGQLDGGDEATGSPQRIAYDLVSATSTAGANDPLVVVIAGANGPASKEAIEGVVSRVAADHDVHGISNPVSGHTSTFITVTPKSAPSSPTTADLVKRLRDLSDDKVAVHVGGATATFIDIASHISSRLPEFIATVLVIAIIGLTLAFRAPVIALQAAAFNVIAYAAAFGVVVAICQHGLGGHLVGLDKPVEIVSFIPLLMFAFVFGLSTDYEVFILGQVRKVYNETHDNTVAVTKGIAATARIVTAAALIMVAVFTGYVLDPDPNIMMMGLGLAVSIFLDAFIVRLLLVPATMAIFGKGNWWRPTFMAKDDHRQTSASNIAS